MPQSISKEDDPEFFQWWVNPVADGDPTPDPKDLKDTQEYIARHYTQETQAQININVRETRE